MPDTLHDLARDLRQFGAERDWLQYHSPKNLASALIVEAGELLEHFQWLTEAESRNLAPAQLDAVCSEVGDVLIYLVQLCTALGIDPVEAARAKLAVNARRFPAKHVKPRPESQAEAPGQRPDPPLDAGC